MASKPLTGSETTLSAYLTREKVERPRTQQYFTVKTYQFKICMKLIQADLIGSPTDGYCNPLYNFVFYSCPCISCNSHHYSMYTRVLFLSLMNDYNRFRKPVTNYCTVIYWLVWTIPLEHKRLSSDDCQVTWIRFSSNGAKVYILCLISGNYFYKTGRNPCLY